VSTSRRQFIQRSIAAGAAVSLGAGLARTAVARAPQGKAPKSLNILILGGTGFLGPATVEAALARGHKVTLFNRGRTEKRTGHDFKDEENVERLYGNRDPEKHAVEDDPESPKGLGSLVGKSFDAVIDNSGYYPRMVRASAELLAPNVKQYVFVSSISAYASTSEPNSDETAPVARLDDPTVETMGDQFQNYGGLKALCEEAAESALPGRVANVRPGYIVGPGDPTDRFTYWPVRADIGGPMIAPGTPDDPVQFIDVRDLGAWLIHIVETGATGVFNACGPKTPARWGDVLDACAAVSSNKPEFVWIPQSFLTEQNLSPGSLPIWLPPEGETAGFHTWSNARAVKAGLTFRPTIDICRDTLAWFKTLPEERRQRLVTRIENSPEMDIIEAWKTRQ